MNQTLRTAVIFAACGTLALTTGACSKQKKGPPAWPPSSVKMAPAVKMDVPVNIKAFGNTEDRASVDIIPQVSGMLIKTFILDGAVVTNGQPLFQIDPSDYDAKVRQAEGVVSADRANLDLSRITLERNKTLLDKKLISLEDFDTLKTRVVAAEAQVRMDEAVLDLARLNLARCLVVAPLAGICSKRYVDDGNLVAAGQSKLTNIRSYDPLDLELSIPETYLTTLRNAMAEDRVKLEIMPRGDTNCYVGALTFLDNAVNPQTGTVMLRGRVPNPDLKLWARQFIDVNIVAGLVHNAIMVPESAMQFGKRGPYVFVVLKDDATKGSKVDMRLVKPGVRHNDLIQIIDGLTEGETVVVLGQLMLYPGAQVMDASAQPPPSAGGMESGAAAKADKKDAKAVK